MQIVKPQQLSLSTRCIEFRQRHGLCITAYVYFPLRAAGPQALYHETTMWPFVAEQLGANAILDEGIAKTTSEFLVCAEAWPPERPAQQCAVRAKVGAREKILVVSGDRYWDHDRPSPSHPFESMRLDWTRAYGGPDDPANPLGRGRVRETHQGVELLPLPNVELATRPLTRPGDSTSPAGFGPLDPMWQQRAGLRGTYDASWYEQHSPGFAPDVDWRHFNLASADQWFDSPLRGDEPFEFDHLHPTKPRLAGVLPGVKARCFIKRGAILDPVPVTPVAMSLSTVWFFPHAERGVLVFHGMCQIGDEFASDVSMLYGAIESIDHEKSWEHYAGVLERRFDRDMGTVHSLIDTDLLPDGLDTSDPKLDAIMADRAADNLAAEAQYRRAELEVAKARSKALRAGADPDALGIRMPVRSKPPTLAELPAFLEKFRSENTPKMVKALDDAAADIIRAARLKEGVKIPAAPTVADLAKAGGVAKALQAGKTVQAAATGAIAAVAAVPAAVAPKLPPKPTLNAGPPKFTAAGELERVKKALALAPPSARAAVDLKALNTNLVMAEMASRGSYLSSAHLQPPHMPMTPKASEQTRNAIAAAAFDNKPLVGVNLTGANLAGMNLAGLDFSHAWLEGVDLTGANLVGANFSFAVLAHARLDGVRASETNFHAANLGKSSFAGADFRGARFDQAVLSGVQFAGASFRGASMIGVDLLDSEFDGADWREVDATGALFLKRSMKGMQLAGARLGNVNFIECDLEDADLTGVFAHSTSFSTCKLARAKFVSCEITQASFVKDCDLTLADLSGARFAQVNLRGAPLAGARMEGFVGDGCDFTGANLDGADLTRARIRDALLIMTSVRNAIAMGIDLKGSTLTRSDWRGSDLRGANLYGSDLSRIVMDAQTLTDGANGRRARLHPRARQEAVS